MTQTKPETRVNPFTAEVNSQSFYLYPSLSQRLHMALRLFEGQSRLILILGETGSGKTLLASQIMARDEGFWKVCRINAHDPTDEPCNRDIKDLKEHRAYMHTRHEWPLVMMDEAHLLTRGELSFLIRLTGVKGYQRQIDKLVFLGSPSLLNHLSEFNDMIPQTGAIEKVFMPRMTVAEARIYLDKHLKAAGVSPAVVFKDAEVEHIHKTAGGYPGGINRAAASLFDRKCRQGKGFSSLIKKILAG